MIKKSILLFYASLSLSSLMAQKNTNSSGGDASNNGGNVSYSIGEIVYTTTTSESGSTEQGVQTAYHVEVITSLDNSSLASSLSVYPNPSSGILNVNTPEGFDNVSYQLLDTSGKSIYQGNLDENITKIDLQNGLNDKVYILRIVQENQEVKSFKIIKN